MKTRILLGLLSVCLLLCLLAACKTANDPTSRTGTQNTKASQSELANNTPETKPSDPAGIPTSEHIHSFGEWTTIKEATCTEDGQRERVCSCGEKETEVLAALGHDLKNNVCTRCGAKASEGLKFELNEDGQSYSVVGIGTCEDIDIIIPNEYEGKPVTMIGRSAFESCTSLTSVTILDSVTEIGGDAFRNCKGLTSIEIPGSVTSIGERAFSGCTGLTSIEIPGSVTSISERTFRYCEGLTSIEIPDSVTSIGKGAFYNCFGLTSIEIPDCVTSIGDDAFGYCYRLTNIKIPKSVTSIGDDAFRGCESLTSITIPKSVTKIGKMAFRGCVSLTSIDVDSNNPVYHSSGNCLIETGTKTLILGCNTSTIPADGSVTEISGGAFRNCKGLTSIEIPDSVTSIGDDAFGGCESLTSITIPKSVTKIGKMAFRGCVSLTSIDVDSNNPVYHSSGNCLIETGTKTLILGCNTSTIPADGSVTSIGELAFSGCTGLTSIEIPDSVTLISWGAFYDCTGLISITIPDSVTSIGDEAFYNCYKLIEVYNRSSLNIVAGSYNFGYVAKYAKRVYNEGSSCLHTTDDGYIFYEDGDEVYLVGYSGNETQLTLPDRYNDKNYGIYQYAFAGCANLTNIMIPDGVTSIGEKAFLGCTSLVYNTYDNANYLGNDNNPCVVLMNAVDQQIQNVTIPSNTKIIYDFAFSGCSSLTNVTIPDSVVMIGQNAFYDCSSLTSITIPFVGNTKNGTTNTRFNYLFGDRSVPSSLKEVTVTGGTIDKEAFYGCSNLSCMKILDGVTYIGSDAFEGCTGLTSLTIPFVGNSKDGTGRTTLRDLFGDKSHPPMKEVTVTGGIIGNSAFYGCSELTSITLPDTLTSIGSSAFERCSSLRSITIPDSVTEIGNFAFKECSSLRSITIPDGVTSIGDGTFERCERLRSITIPDTVTEIGWGAFQYCYSLRSVIIPDGVTEIGDGTFEHCCSLISVTIGSGVTEFILNPFRGCSKIIEVYNRSSLKSIPGLSSAKHIYEEGESYLHTTDDGYIFYEDGDEVYLVGYSGNETELTLPELYNGKTYSIYQYAFAYCRSLTSITIPNSVTSIDSYAFYKCESLTSVTIPDSVTSIGNSAFSSCTSLTSVTIPNSMTKIGSEAFYYCTSLTSVTIPDSVTKIGSCAFFNCTSLKTVYYRGTEEQWSHISIGSGNDQLTNATIVYNYTGD